MEKEMAKKVEENIDFSLQRPLWDKPTECAELRQFFEGFELLGLDENEESEKVEIQKSEEPKSEEPKDKEPKDGERAAQKPEKSNKKNRRFPHPRGLNKVKNP